MAIMLMFYEEKAQKLIDRYTITEEQLRYTISPQDSIELAMQDTSRHAILAMDGDKLVTFFVLHEKEGVKPYSSNEQALLIRAFSTDYFEQGKGYAKKVLQLLPDFVRKHFSHINELVLGVNVPNIAAQALYKKCGFVDEGRLVKGLRDEIKVMSYTIKDDGNWGK
ncbi:GNAT family N-acetyltransferase [Lysinibacillus cavernae]|uniref:GNAT family N-acetyltransferase n=1 Tax=Lysinibacillus cavernae TaxID=2666135 RepID=UPI0012D8E43C|nr:GNAT family N-acetyltransferase [Lysinibacillus cavernae]